MKKFCGLFAIGLFGFCFNVFALEDLNGCNNKTYYAANTSDAFEIFADFTANCCKGSTVIIYNIETGIGGSFTTSSNGVNSSCNEFNAE